MISVIIPAYNEERTVQACIKSLLTQEYEGDYEIIFIDNNSTDTTGDIARTFNNITVITEKRQGVTWARLAGFKAAKGDVIAYIDADCIADPSWLGAIAQSFKDQKVIALSGRVCFDTPSKDPFYFDALYWNIWHPLRFKLGKPMFWGANMAIRKSSLKEDYFPTTLKAYEDLILGQQLKRNKKPGEKIIYNSNTIVTTFDTPSHMPERTPLDHFLADFGIFRKKMKH